MPYARMHRMRRLTLSALCLALLGFAVYAQISGYEYDGVLPGTNLPGGFRHLGGALLTDAAQDPVYGVSQVVRGKQMSFWLEVSVKRDENGIARWRVLDAVTFPAPAAGQIAVLPLDPLVECQLRKSKPLENLVAVGRVNQRRGRFFAERAWIADAAAGRFRPVRAGDLQCIFSEP